MTTAPRQHQPPPAAPASSAREHLAAIAASLAGHGLPSRLDILAGTPVLTIDEPAAGPDPAAVAIDPDTSGSPGLRLDCTCTWTPAPGTAPETTAATILAVLTAIRPAAHQPPAAGQGKPSLSRTGSGACPQHDPPPPAGS
jgi:hypothetical protein